MMKIQLSRTSSPELPNKDNDNDAPIKDIFVLIPSYTVVRPLSSLCRYKQHLMPTQLSSASQLTAYLFSHLSQPVLNDESERNGLGIGSDIGKISENTPSTFQVTGAPPVIHA